MVSNFSKVLRSFLNLIYQPVLIQENKEAQQTIVKKVTIDVLLKNQRLLADVWR